MLLRFFKRFNSWFTGWHYWVVVVVGIILAAPLSIYWYDNHFGSWRVFAIIAAPICALWGCYKVYHWSKS